MAMCPTEYKRDGDASWNWPWMHPPSYPGRIWYTHMLNFCFALFLFVVFVVVLAVTDVGMMMMQSGMMKGGFNNTTATSYQSYLEGRPCPRYIMLQLGLLESPSVRPTVGWQFELALTHSLTLFLCLFCFHFPLPEIFLSVSYLSLNWLHSELILQW